MRKNPGIFAALILLVLSISFIAGCSKKPTNAGFASACIDSPVGTITSGTPFTFTSGCSGSSGTISSYDWNFGDGTAHATTASPSHTYAVANTYTITLTITSGSSTSTAQKTVTVVQ